jgi:hypothetical protein
MLTILCLVLLFLGSAPSWAADAPPDSSGAGGARPEPTPPAQPGGPVLNAAPLSGEIHVDGRLDESAWRFAVPVDRFTQSEPKEGAPATERTEVRAVVGDNTLYFGARLYDTDAKRIRSRLVRRDEDLNSDYFEVSLDPYHDRLTGVVFRVSPSGSINDATIAPNGNQDASWDPIWDARTTVDSLGWTVEIEIPLSQLKYNSGGDGTWGLQLRRWIHRDQELSEFAFSPKKEDRGVSKFGTLTGMGGIHAPSRLEVLPYALVQSQHMRVPADDPFQIPTAKFQAAGMDLKYGVSSNLTLNATVNPDFGEVEVDPAVVNLSAFETFYPERRPFFVEGADIFQFGETHSYNNFNTTIPFHARRIGRPPQRELTGTDYVYVDAPLQTTISAAAKLTGKTSGGWTLGVLDALTPQEMAAYTDTVGATNRAAVEPLTNYFTGRVRRDYDHGNTTVGAIVTSVHRTLDNPDLQGLLRSRSIAGGFDWNRFWSGRHWVLDGMFLVSHVQGSDSAMAITQRSSARYYQRPDADYLHYDPTRQDLSGYAGFVSLNKIAGEHWLGSVTYQDWSPGFEINDLGFQNAADSRGLSWLGMYKEDQPSGLLRNWNTFVYSNWSWNYGGNNTFAAYAAQVQGQFRNFWSANLRGAWYPGNYDDRLTRGGPLSRLPSQGSLRGGVTTDPRKTYTLGLNGVDAWDEAGGTYRSISASLSMRPTTALHLAVAPGLQKTYDNAQYVTAVVDPTATATYGSRYVFATLDQTQFSVETRLDWTFSPKLSLQLYMQPLIVSGDYSELKQLRAPGTYEFDVYGGNAGTVTYDEAGNATVDPDGAGPAAPFEVDNPNFNYRSLRGNAVLRWEYRPGSALFLVWQQGREAVAPYGDFDFSRDWHALYDIVPVNLIALKATYWLPL